MQEMQEIWAWSPGQKGSLEEMTTHSSILAWEVQWTEEPGGLQSLGSQRVGHDWVTEHVCQAWCRTIYKGQCSALMLVMLGVLLFLTLERERMISWIQKESQGGRTMWRGVEPAFGKSKGGCRGINTPSSFSSNALTSLKPTKGPRSKEPLNKCADVRLLWKREWWRE